MQVSRALIGAGAGLALLYIVLLTAYFAFSSRHTPAPVATGVRYEVTTAGGEVHALDDIPDDPGGALLEAQRRYGEITGVRRLEPGETSVADMPTSKPRASSLLAFGLLIFPIGLLLAGLRAQQRASHEQRLWGALSNSLTADSQQLQRGLALNDADMHQAIARINALGRAQLVWDLATHRVYDRRLSDHTITVQFCPRCNDPINVRVIADLQHVPKCPNCLYAVDRHELDRLKAGIVQTLIRDSKADAPRDFSLGLFVVLALLFPPGAIFYGVRHS